MRIEQINLLGKAQNINIPKTEEKFNVGLFDKAGMAAESQHGDEDMAMVEIYLKSLSGVSEQTKEYLRKDERFIKNTVEYCNGYFRNNKFDGKMEKLLTSYVKTIQNWKDGVTVTKDYSSVVSDGTKDTQSTKAVTLIKITLDNGKKAYQAEDGTVYGLSDSGDVDFTSVINNETNNNPSITEKSPQKPQNKKTGEREVNTEGISGTYQITGDNNSFSVDMNFNVQDLYKNQAANAFNEGLDSAYHQDKDGYYNFRGVKSKNLSVFRHLVSAKAQQVAINTAIYNDLANKSRNGEPLTKPEQNFMKSYLKTLDGLGLKINDKGELSDK